MFHWNFSATLAVTTCGFSFRWNDWIWITIYLNIISQMFILLPFFSSSILRYFNWTVEDFISILFSIKKPNTRLNCDCQTMSINVVLLRQLVVVVVVTFFVLFCLFLFGFFFLNCKRISETDLCDTFRWNKVKKIIYC